MIELSVYIPKVVAHTNGIFKYGFHQQIEVGAPAGKHEGGFVFHDGAFQRKFRRNKANGACTMNTRHISFLHINVYHRA